MSRTTDIAPQSPFNTQAGCSRPSLELTRFSYKRAVPCPIYGSYHSSLHSVKLGEEHNHHESLLQLSRHCMLPVPPIYIAILAVNPIIAPGLDANSLHAPDLLVQSLLELQGVCQGDYDLLRRHCPVSAIELRDGELACMIS